MDDSYDVWNHTNNSIILNLPRKPTACVIANQSLLVAVDNTFKVFDLNGAETFAEEFQNEIIQLEAKSPNEILVIFEKCLIVKRECDLGKTVRSYTFVNAINEAAGSDNYIVVRFSSSLEVIGDDGSFHFRSENVSPTSSE